jgi:hypothetical protein
VIRDWKEFYLAPRWFDDGQFTCWLFYAVHLCNVNSEIMSVITMMREFVKNLTKLKLSKWWNTPRSRCRMTNRKDLGHKNNSVKNGGAGRCRTSLIARLMIRPPWNASTAAGFIQGVPEKEQSRCAASLRLNFDASSFPSESSRGKSASVISCKISTSQWNLKLKFAGSFLKS